jgi:hypothetical protein
MMTTETQSYVLVAICDRAHEQRIRIEGRSRDWIAGLAALLDGTSPYYIHPPGPNTVLGKCGLCGAQIRCRVEEDKGETL